MRILVVEDDEGIAQGLRTMLRQQGAAVDVVGGVASAWRALRAEPFDKPFDAGELAARMRALQRRARGRTNPHVVRGDIAIDTTHRLVRRGDVAVDLSAKEYTLLLMLVDASPCVLSRSQIQERLYNFEVAIDSNTIEVHVHHLRRKLGEKFIRTMRGVGYFIPTDSTP